MPDLLKRIAALEKELERARAQNNVSAPIDTVTPSQLTPFWSGPLLSLIRSQLSGIREVPNISEHNLAKIIPFAARSTLTWCVLLWTSKGKNQGVDCYMQASTKTEASDKTAVSEVVQTVEGNVQLKAAETSTELRHQRG
ncbi:GL20964 [Drosophila persimilis]|uniref:GL20964 n=1 Tax=Drosophila persimilis TaxID=7234 RepID=B4HCH8_DROPE|nr:GL20964 [Drosophila persimilis]